MRLTVGSLFAGVGGIPLGFHRAGFRSEWMVEWDKHCQAVLRRRFPDVEVYGDVRDVAGGPVDMGRLQPVGERGRQPLPASRVSDDPRSVLRPVDVIDFGFPCQDLSVAGRRAGLDGHRSGLFFDAVRIIKEMRHATGGTHPTWAVAENVPGLLSADDGAAMGRCLDELADAGALVIEWAVLDARWFGVPQRRRRVFIVACFDPAAAARCPDPLLPVGPRGARHPHQGDPAGQIVAGAFEDRVGIDFVGALAGIPPGGGWRIGPDEAAVGHIVPMTDDLAVRRLLPVECERLQGFPDGWTEGQADSNRYKQMGNAVCVPVAEWVGRQIVRAAA